MNRFLESFIERGFMHQCTDLEGLHKVSPLTAYIGFDCTATSLHVGSLMQIMILRMLQKTGNKPIVLFGGGTSKIGDPSLRDEARKLMDNDTISVNKAGIKKAIAKFVDLDQAIVVDNDDWLAGINYIEFLRDYGKHFSVNRMLSFDSVKLRLDREQSLSFLEFNYMILQAYDFVELNKRYGCRLQIGGSDQWGNIVNGTDLGHRVGLKEQLYGLTTPLITTSSGAKMGKTAAGAVWLDEDLLSPYDYYQFWRNTEDADVIRFLKIFTELSLAEINELAKLQGSEINEAKKILAFEATRLCHGEANAEKAADAARTAFEQGGTAGLPEITLEKKSYRVTELFVAAGLATSNGEAKRLIQGGGAKINDEKVSDENMALEPSDGMKLSSGKKKHVVVRI